MSLRDILTGIVEGVDGAMAAIIMANDGIPIDEAYVAQTEFDLQSLAVEYATLIKDIRRTVSILKVGDLEEVSIATGQVSVVIRILDKDLFVVLILAKDGNVGMGRYQLRLKLDSMAQELA